MDVDSDFSCSKCDYKTRIPFNLRRHMNIIHSVVGENIYKCNICNDSYSTFKKLNDHKATCSIQNSNMEILNAETMDVNNQGLIQQTNTAFNYVNTVYYDTDNLYVYFISDGWTNVTDTPQQSYQEKEIGISTSFNSENIQYPSDEAQQSATMAFKTESADMCTLENQLNCIFAKKSTPEQSEQSKPKLHTAGSSNIQKQLSSEIKQKNRMRKANQTTFQENVTDANSNKTLKMEIQDNNESELSTHNLVPSIPKPMKDIHQHNGPFKCNFCPSNYSHSRNLNRHIKETHVDPRTLQCNFCNQDFNKLSILDYHILTSHTEIRRYKCNHCDFGTNRKGIYLRHIKRCLRGKALDSIDESLQFQGMDPNNSNERKKEGTTAMEEFTCHFCGMPHESIPKLIRHIKTHGKNDRPGNYDEVTRKTDPTSSGKNIKDDTSKEKQIKTKDEESIPLKIDSYKMGENSSLQKPESGQKAKNPEKKTRMFHTEFKIGPQRICTKQRNLHTNNNKGNPLEKCNICAKSFAHKHTLKYHTQHVHENPRAFKCNICQLKFSYKCNLQSHITKMHANCDDYLEQLNNLTPTKCNVTGVKGKSENIPNETKIALEKALELIDSQSLEEDLDKYNCKLCSIT